MYAKPKLPMKKRTILILTILAAGLLMWKWLACGYNPDKPTEFYPIFSRQTKRVKYEAFVVSNAPCDTGELRKVVEKYNFEIWSLDTLKKYKALERIFYKETKYMTKDFREGDEYNPIFDNWDNVKDFRNHAKDILIQSRYYLDGINGKKYYRIWINGDYDDRMDDMYMNRIEESFYDLGSFYREKRKIYDTH